MASSSTHDVKIYEDDIHNDVLIEEVERRPPLYDKTDKLYTDINWKSNAWEEVSKIIFSNVWDNLSQETKIEAGKIVQKRWKNLRACFSRELRVQKSGRAYKKRRKYRHFDQLLFLIPSMDTNTTKNSSENTQDIDCEEEEERSKNIYKDVPQQKQYSGKKKANAIPQKERIQNILDTKWVDDNQFIETVRNNKRNSDDDDWEKHFALSLVPLLKAVPEENRLEVQIKILQVIQDVQKQNTHSSQRIYSPTSIYQEV